MRSLVPGARRALAVAALVWGLGGAAAAEDPPAAAPETVDTRVTELQTAGYYELVDRAREAGLDTSGGVPELRRRIAEAWKVTLPADPPGGNRTLTVDAAQEAGLITVEAPGEGKLLRLSGGLHVTLVDNDKKATHVIEAGELWYDEENEELTARGGVTYTLISGSTKEVLKGESLTFRISDAQGIFYDSYSDKSRSVGTQALTFRYAGQAVRRSSGDLVTMDRGTITSSLGTDPYYRIEAKKIWVLAPGEWGLKDAVLYVGRVPMLYFPFFFQPGDDFVFNPVLSFPDPGDRRGTALQTTTYIWGKKTRATAPLSFLQLSDAPQDDTKVRRGLFLVKGTPAAKSSVPDTWSLKILADFYSNLGFLTGVQGSAPGAFGLKTLTGTFGLGVTRTVTTDGLPFTVSPFNALLDPWDQSDWNGSYVGAVRLPFRWGGNFAADAGWGSVSWEYYTDPYFSSDLTANRSENFNMFSFLGLGTVKQTTTASTKSSLQWTAKGLWGPGSAETTLQWVSDDKEPAGPANDPENKFYRPSQLTLPLVRGSFSGSLWPLTIKGLGTPASPAKSRAGFSDLVPAPDPGAVPSSPLESPVGPEVPGAAAAPAAAEVPAADPAADLTAPGRLENRTAASSAQATWSTTATWSVSPSAQSDTFFDQSVGTSPEDDLTKLKFARWKGAYDAQVRLGGGWSDGSFTTAETVSLSQKYQDTWAFGSQVADADQSTYLTQDETARTSLLTQSLTSAWKPLISLKPLRESSVQYTLTTKLWQDNSAGTTWFDGTTDTVTAHQVNPQTVWYLLEGPVTLKAQAGLVSTLPPLDPLETWSGSLTLAALGAKATTGASAKQTSSDFTWDPWTSEASWTAGPVTTSGTFVYNLDQERPQSASVRAEAFGLKAQYRAQQTLPYEFDTVNKKWTATGPLGFHPSELRFDYGLNLPNVQWWRYRNTLSTTVNASWPMNLQQFTSMPLTLSYTLNYKLARFLDFQVSEGITNRTGYKYFPFLLDKLGLADQAVNPLTDLADALSVWDRAALERTGFKMSTLTLGMTHYLEDWQVNLSYSGSPQLNTAGTEYAWKGVLTLLVQWLPVPELKTNVQWDKDGNINVLKNTGS